MTENLNNKRTGLILFLIFLLALGLLLGSLSCYRFVGADGGIDGVVMAVSGQNLFSGNGLAFQGRAQTVHSPAFPVLVGLAWTITGNLELGGQLVSVIFGALLVFPVFRLGKALFDGRIGIYAALLSAVFPPFIYASTEIRVVPLYTTLFIFSLFLSYRFALAPGFGAGLAAGAGAGLLYLARPEAVLFVSLTAILPFLAGRERRNRGAGGVIIGWLGMATSFTVISLPYWLFLHRHLGRWTMNGRGPFTFAGYFGENWEKAYYYLYTYRDEAMRQWLERGGMGGFLRVHGGELIGKFFQNLISFIDLGNSPQIRKIGLSRSLVDGVVIAALLALLVVSIRKIVTRKWRFRDTFLLLFFLTALQYLALSAGDMRYFYPYIPLGVILLSAFVVGWKRKFSQKSPRTRSARIIGTGPGWLLIGLSIFATAYMIPRKIDTVPYEYKILGRWMKENLPGVEKETILSRKLGVPFYTGSPHGLIYPGSYSEALDHARKTGAEYLVIDEWTIPWARPEMVFLLEASPPPPELERVHTINHRGRKIILYRFTSAPARRDPSSSERSQGG